MPLPSLRSKPRMLVASGQRVRTRDQDNAYVKRTEMPWQRQALALYDLVPELHYAGQFYARMLSKVKIFPAELHSPDSEHPKKIETGLPFDILNQIQDPGGGHSQLLFKYGQLMFITGDGFLLGRDLEQDLESWTFVWRDELRFENGKVTHLLAPNFPPKDYNDIPDDAYAPINPGSAVAYRMWTPHPRASAWPDSPMRGVLEIGEELLILTKSVHSTATSRLARAPLLKMPIEIMPPPVEAGADEDPENDPFQADFTEYLQYAIENPSSADASSPFVLWAAYDYLDRVDTVTLHDPATDYVERDLRAEAVKRLGYSLDMPPEVLIGYANSNHWSAAAIMDAIWNDHGDPKMKQFCHDLADMYLRPALRDEGYEDWQNVTVWYDPTEVVINPDRSDDANEAWDRGAIGYLGYRRMKSIPEEYAQSEEEHTEWLETKLVRIREAQPGVAEPLDVPGQGPPPGGPENVTGIRQGKKPTVMASGRELGAAELALLRCREMAGIRLRRLKTCPSCLEAATGQPAAMVASLVGVEGVQQLGVSDMRELVRGGADQFRSLLSSWGYHPSGADVLAQIVEAHAARTLFEHHLPSMPDGFVAHVERTREAM